GPEGGGGGGPLAWRGGRKTIRAVSSTPGNSEIVGGTTAAQPAESPRIPSVNSSTTAPVLRSRNSRVASEPGSTATTGAVSVTDAPTRRSVTATGAAEHADLRPPPGGRMGHPGPARLPVRADPRARRSLR